MSAKRKLTNADKERLLKQKLTLATPLLFIMVLIPILGFFGFFSVREDTPAIWFQRSGSLMVLFGLLIEYTLFSIDDELFSIGTLNKKELKLLKKYQIHYASMKYLGIIGAVVGTIIWGSSGNCPNPAKKHLSFCIC